MLCICRFHICEFASPQKFICDTRINKVLSWSLPDTGRGLKNLGRHVHTSQQRSKKAKLHLLVSALRLETSALLTDYKQAIFVCYGG